METWKLYGNYCNFTSVLIILEPLPQGSILKTSSANKTGLSYQLDGTMRSGAHDMKTFGAGTLRSLSSLEALNVFFHGHLQFYGAMERHLDAMGPDTASGRGTKKPQTCPKS